MSLQIPDDLTSSPFLSFHGDMSWMDGASCASYPEDIWFENTKGVFIDEAKAKAICAECPGREQCEAFGMGVTKTLWENRQRNNDFGIYAGLTPRDRADRLRAAIADGLEIRSTRRKRAA